MASQPDKNIAVDLFAGTMAGTAQLVVGHPFDTIKVKLQTQSGKYKGAIDCTKQVLQTHGPKGLFKGMGTPLATVALFNAVLFSARGQMENMLAHPDGSALTVQDQVIAGIGAGVAGSFLACPTELIKCRLQAQSGPRPAAPLVVPGSSAVPVVRYSGPMSVVQHVMAKEGGMVGLFRGMTPTLLREIPGNAAMFGVYGWLKGAMASAAGLKRVEELPKGYLLGAGGLAGAAFWLVSYPADVIKSKIQTDVVQQPKYHGTVDCAQQIWKSEGMAGFWRGFGPAFVRSMPANAAAFGMYEVCVSLFYKQPAEQVKTQLQPGVPTPDAAAATAAPEFKPAPVV